VVDVHTKKTRDLGEGFQPSWSPQGQWIAINASGQIWLIRPDGSGRHALGVRGFTTSWSPDGKTIAYDDLADGRDGIFIIDSAGGKEATLRAPGAMPAWSPSGDQIAYLSGTFLDMTIMRADGADPTLFSRLPVDSFSWSPTGASLVVAVIVGQSFAPTPPPQNE
jgi:Tol biopolymer transport system component